MKNVDLKDFEPLLYTSGCRSVISQLFTRFSNKITWVDFGEIDPDFPLLKKEISLEYLFSFISEAEQDAPINYNVIRLIKLLVEKGIVEISELEQHVYIEVDMAFLFATVKVIKKGRLYDLMEFFSNATVEEPYGFPKQLLIVKENIKRKYDEFENEKLVFKWNDLPIFDQKHIQIISTLWRLEKEGYLKLDIQHVDLNIKERHGLINLEATVLVKDKIKNLRADDHTALGKTEVKPPKAVFDEEKSHIRFKGEIIKIPKYKNQYYLCLCLFKKPGEECEKMDVEDVMGDKLKRLGLYNAARSINGKVATETGIKDFLNYKIRYANINPKYA